MKSETDTSPAEPPTRRHRGLLLAAKIWCGVFFAILIASYIWLPQSKVTSDYETSIYVAGRLVNSGQADKLYPPAGATSFMGAPFDLATHQTLNGLPPKLVAIYMYSPLVAVAFSPLSRLAPNAAFACFQLLSVLALIICGLLSTKLAAGSGKPIFWLTFLFLPAIATLWIGQLGLLLGLLPLWGAYYLLGRGKPFWAGIAISALALKTQLLPVAGLCALVLLLKRRPAMMIGLLSGLSVLLLLSAFSISPTVFSSWLASFRISETILTGSNLTYPEYLVACFPGSVLSQVPADSKAALKPIVYAIAFGLGLASLYVCMKVRRWPDNSDNEKSVGKGTLRHDSLLFVCAIFSLPLYCPHLLLYDLCIFLLPAAIVTCLDDSFQFLRKPVIVSLLAIDLYILLIVVLPVTPPPLVLAAVLMVGFFAIAKKALSA